MPLRPTNIRERKGRLTLMAVSSWYPSCCDSNSHGLAASGGSHRGVRCSLQQSDKIKHLRLVDTCCKQKIQNKVFNRSVRTWNPK